MKKSVFTRFLAAAAALSMLAVSAGCGGKDSSSESGSSSKEDNSLQEVIDSGKFVLGLDATFKPMGYTDENDEIVGFDIDVAEEVCERMGVDLADPYMKNAMVFVVPADSDAETMDDLANAAVGVQNGSTAQTILEGSEIGSSCSIQAMATNIEALQQMEFGLVDAVFLDSVVAEYEITSSGKDYVILPDGLEEEEYAIGFRKNDQKLRDEVQKILGEMKADGTLGKISTEWFGSDITTVK